MDASLKKFRLLMARKTTRFRQSDRVIDGKEGKKPFTTLRTFPHQTGTEDEHFSNFSSVSRHAMSDISEEESEGVVWHICKDCEELETGSKDCYACDKCAELSRLIGSGSNTEYGDEEHWYNHKVFVIKCRKCSQLVGILLDGASENVNEDLGVDVGVEVDINGDVDVDVDLNGEINEVAEDHVEAEGETTVTSVEDPINGKENIQDLAGFTDLTLEDKTDKLKHKKRDSLQYYMPRLSNALADLKRSPVITAPVGYNTSDFGDVTSSFRPRNRNKNRYTKKADLWRISRTKSENQAKKNKQCMCFSCQRSNKAIELTSEISDEPSGISIAAAKAACEQQEDTAKTNSVISENVEELSECVPSVKNSYKQANNQLYNLQPWENHTVELELVQLKGSQSENLILPLQKTDYGPKYENCSKNLPVTNKISQENGMTANKNTELIQVHLSDTSIGTSASDNWGDNTRYIDKSNAALPFLYADFYNGVSTESNENAELRF